MTVGDNISVYGVVSTPQENIVLSPFSILTALEIVRSGVTGESLKALTAFKGNQACPRDYKGLVNAVFYTSATTDFLESAKAQFNVHLEPYENEDQVNAWASDATNGKIQQLVSALGDVAIVICSAIYFEQEWVVPFSARDSFEGTFHCSKESSVKQRYMAKKSMRTYYMQDEENKYLGLRYKDGTIFVIELGPASPRRGNIPRLLNHQESVDVTIPKFKIESKFDLGDYAVGLGIEPLFKFSGDFVPMTGRNDAVGAILHKAVIEVDEKGTVAAAATAVAVLASAMPMRNKVFFANSPFHYYIYDPSHELVLFDGAFYGDKEASVGS